MSAATVNVPVIDLGGRALDWAVAKIEGLKPFTDGISWIVEKGGQYRQLPRYSADWAAGGPLIEGAGISLDYRPPGGSADWYAYTDDYALYASGPSALVAAMRCYVLGRTIGTNGRPLLVPAALVPTAPGGAA